MNRVVSVSSGAPTIGEWTIETGRSGDGTVAAFNQAARDAVAAFLSGFGELVRVERATADLMSLGPDRRVTRVDETVAVTVTDGGLNLPADAPLLTSLFLSCALSVQTATGSPGHSGGLHFMYDVLVDVDDEDRADPVDASSTVTVNVDAWAGPDGQANRDLLAAALRAWEARLAQPITEWTSNVRWLRVDRYGFVDAG